jgi:hypothetical protein
VPGNLIPQFVSYVCIECTQTSTQIITRKHTNSCIHKTHTDHTRTHTLGNHRLHVPARLHRSGQLFSARKDREAESRECLRGTPHRLQVEPEPHSSCWIQFIHHGTPRHAPQWPQDEPRFKQYCPHVLSANNCFCLTGHGHGISHRSRVTVMASLIFSFLTSSLAHGQYAS